MLAAVGALSFSTLAHASVQSGNVYSLNDFLPISGASLISGKLITPVNVKQDGSVFVVIPDGNVSFFSDLAGSAMPGKIIKVPELKQCLVVGHVFYTTMSTKEKPDSTLKMDKLICPNQVIEPGSAANHFIHYLPKPSTAKANMAFTKNVPIGTRVQMFTAFQYTKSPCNEDQYKQFLVNNFSKGSAFQEGFWAGCNGVASMNGSGS